MNDTPTVKKIQRHAGIAGQSSYTATVQYDDEPESSVTFVGSEVYGGPVVMVTEHGQTFVMEPERFGPFGREWVARFFVPLD